MPRFSIKLSTIVMCSLLACVACTDSNPESARAPQASAAQNLYAQFEQRARVMASAASSETSSISSDHKTAAFIHSDEPLEFWQYLAILSDQQGNHYALQQRFVRLKLETSAVLATSGMSQSMWSYSHLVAMDYQFEHLTTGQLDTHAAAQREALDLSGVDVAQQKIWLDAFTAQNHSMSICQPSIQLTSPSFSLRFGASAAQHSSCDDNAASAIEYAAGFALLRGVAMPVSGTYVSSTQSFSLNGHGWVVQGWGVPPDSSEAAVVFDRAWLLMSSDSTESGVQLQRSRRASGRGPLITTGSLTELGSNLAPTPQTLELTAALVDDDSKPTNGIPSAWQFTSPQNDIAITLKPVAGADENSSLPSQSWFGVVAIDGTHSGFGFIDYSLR